ncbi:MAG TPA: hypothetical protein VEJ67_08700 [Candidatus Cybelea sp.]|nr:hypothetical protein [Candidatus Cybelea sp.]
MRRAVMAAVLVFALTVPLTDCRERQSENQAEPRNRPKIEAITPPEDGFFAKELTYKGILIKAPSVVADEALYVLYGRMARQTAQLPTVVTNLAAAGAEVHIIGRNQVTTDLPEWRQDKHVPLDEYNGLTRDQRTRGMGGLKTSCAEENLLQLFADRYRGRDICTHEFAHNIENYGIPPAVRAMFDKQYEISKSKGLWINSYAGSNPDEYFAELTMWYFGTHGDLSMTDPIPANGPEGLRQYDPDAYKLFDDFYSGRIEIATLEPVPHNTEDARSSPPSDSLVARGMVAKLISYEVGQTRITDFFKDAGISAPADGGTGGWHVNEGFLSRARAEIRLSGAGSHQFQVSFRNPANRNAADRPLARLTFRNGVLARFQWDN